MSVHKSKKITKDGRSWFFKQYYKDINGNLKPYVSKNYLTKKEAKEEEALYLLKNNKTKHIKFSLVAKEYFGNLSKTRKSATFYTYKNAYNVQIKDFFEELDIYTIDTQILLQWREIIEKKNLSYNYKNKLHCILKNIFNHAVKYYKLDKNPETILGAFEQKNEKIIKDKDKLRYITYDEFNRFINIIDDSMWKTFFMFLYYTGCRKGEVQALTWKDIDLENNTIKIYKTLSVKTTEKYTITNTKNKINREIKMNLTLNKQLAEYKKIVQQYTDFCESWFVFGNTRFLAQTSIDNNKHKYFKVAGIKEITIHEFRHSHVSLLINEYIKTSKEKNMKVDTAKFFLMMSNRMGHSIQVMQDTYMHLFPSIQDEIVDLLDNL